MSFMGPCILQVYGLSLASCLPALRQDVAGAGSLSRFPRRNSNGLGFRVSGLGSQDQRSGASGLELQAHLAGQKSPPERLTFGRDLSDVGRALTSASSGGRWQPGLPSSQDLGLGFKMQGLGFRA